MAALSALRSGHPAPVEVRQAGAVTAQVVGQRVEPDEPALVLDVAGAGVCRGLAVRDGCHRGRAVGGEDALDERGDGDDVPLESLGRVHGEHLHGVGVGLGVPGVESALLVAGGVEPAEEARERGPVGGRGVARRDVGEGVEVHARGRGRVLGTREHLDVETDRHLGLGDEVDERQRREPTQAPHDVAEVVQPGQGLVADAGAVASGPPGPGQVVEGLDERGGVGAVGREVGAAAVGGGRVGRGSSRRRPASAARQPPAGRVDGVGRGHRRGRVGSGRGGAPDARRPGVQLARPGPQPGQVGRAEAHDGPGEQAHQLVAAAWGPARPRARRRGR